MDRLSRAPLWAVLALLLALAVGFLPGQGAIPVLDRDEGRFAQASKQMIETGDFVDIRFQEEPRYKKPILIYWLQSASASLQGGPEAPIRAYRLPSLVGAVLGVLLTFWAGIPVVGRRAAALGAATVALTVVLQGEARIAKTDAMLFAASTAALGALAWLRFGTGRRLFPAAVLWTALAAGLLLKGPLILIPVLGLMLVTSLRDRSPAWLSRTRPLPGIAWCLLLTLPWFVAIWFVSDGAFYGASLGGDFAAKVATGVEAHGAPPGSYLAVFWIGFWPGTAFVLLALPWVLRNWRSAPVVFLLAWVLPFWIVLEATPTKLPHYNLPLYGALALLAAKGTLETGGAAPRWLRWLAALVWALGLLVVAGLALGLPLALDGAPNLVATVLALAALAVGVLALSDLLRGALARFALAAAATALTAYLALFGVTLPGLTAPFFGERLRAAEAACGIAADAVTGLSGYTEPSAVFALGTETLRLDTEGTRAAFDQGIPVWIEARRLGEVFGGTPPEAQARVRGINYNGGRETDLGLYSRRPLGCPPDATLD